MDHEAEIDVDFLCQTELAIKVTDGDVEAWLPKSELINFEEDDKLKEGDHFSLTLPEWLALGKNLC